MGERLDRSLSALPRAEHFVYLLTFFHRFVGRLYGRPRRVSGVRALWDPQRSACCTWSSVYPCWRTWGERILQPFSHARYVALFEPRRFFV